MGAESETIKVNTWDDLLNYSTQSGNTYTLDQYLKYELELSSGAGTKKNITIVIPQNVTVENMCMLGSAGNKLQSTDLNEGVQIINYGTFNNYGAIRVIAFNDNCFTEDIAEVTIENYGTFTNGNDSRTSGFIVSAGVLRINNMENATFNINHKMYTTGVNSAIIFDGDGNININNGKIYTKGGGSTITFAGNGTINNNGLISPNVANSIIIFSQNVCNSGNSSIPGKIYCVEGGEAKIESEITLSFGDYGQLYGKDSTQNIILDGIIKFISGNDPSFYNLNISSGYGSVDMGKIQEYSVDAIGISDFSDKIHDISIAEKSSEEVPASISVSLPFNCKFSNVDLSNAANIYYTILKITKVGVDNSNVIKKIVNTYGDYADSNNNFGVTLPKNTNGTLNINKVHIAEETQDEAYMSLSELVGDITTYNISGAGYYLFTNYLDDVADIIAAGITHDYNFGFIGEKAISITPEEEAENTKATFKGDNRGYNPSTPATISVAEVEFGASGSLFQFSHEYGKGTFTKGNFTNTIPANKTIEFTNGFTLGAGHKLIVKGTLIG